MDVDLYNGDQAVGELQREVTLKPDSTSVVELLGSDEFVDFTERRVHLKRMELSRRLKQRTPRRRRRGRTEAEASIRLADASRSAGTAMWSMLNRPSIRCGRSGGGNVQVESHQGREQAGSAADGAGELAIRQCVVPVATPDQPVARQSGPGRPRPGCGWSCRPCGPRRTSECRRHSRAAPSWRQSSRRSGQGLWRSGGSGDGVSGSREATAAHVLAAVIGADVRCRK